MSTFEGSTGSAQRAIAQGEEVAPAVRAMEGSKGLIYLADVAAGRTLAITLWETEEAMQASEEAANQLRRETSEAAGETIASVDRYEVVLFDID